MRWEQLLSGKRQRGAYGKTTRSSTDLRSEFEKDYHRIIGSASFRRLQDKTQVFPLDKSDFIRTRLTHSLEVSSLGKSLGQNIGEYILTYIKDAEFTAGMKEDICNILQCAGLIHDIGNPPFGHFGETAIREWFQKNLPVLEYKGKKLEDILLPQMKEDFLNFEGNAQALRLVTKLHYLVDENGMNLTYALLNTIVKYPVSSLEMKQNAQDIREKKMGYYYADRELLSEIEQETGTCGRRHPLTFILEAADDLAYKTADVEDAFVKGFLSYYQLREELKKLEEKYPELSFDALESLDRKYKRGIERGVSSPEEYAVKNWIVQVQSFLINCVTEGFTSHYGEIMEGTYPYDLFHGTAAEPLMDLLGEIARRYVFTSSSIYRMEVTEAGIIDELMSMFMRAAIKYDTDEQLDSIDERMIAFISGNYKNAYYCHAKGTDETEKLYLRLLLVTDYICGMTDSYAKRLYQELKGILS